MNHKVKSVLLMSVLLGIMVLIGLLANLNEGITGSTVAGSLACNEDKDCDDQIRATEDTCRNPGTGYSLCINRPRE